MAAAAALALSGLALGVRWPVGGHSAALVNFLALALGVVALFGALSAADRRQAEVVAAWAPALWLAAALFGAVKVP